MIAVNRWTDMLYGIIFFPLYYEIWVLLGELYIERAREGSLNQIKFAQIMQEQH